MRFVKRFSQFSLLLTALLLNGCYLEQGQLHFVELNLDPITVYKMAPLERTIFCVEAGEIPGNGAFEELHAWNLAAVENDPENSDWSELVCLSLSAEASPEQIKQTVDALELVIAVHPKNTNPVRSFKYLLEQKITLFDRIKAISQRADNEKQKSDKQAAMYEDEIGKMRLQIEQQLDEIQQSQQHRRELEQQVRKLKEVELLLQPKQ